MKTRHYLTRTIVKFIRYRIIGKYRMIDRMLYWAKQLISSLELNQKDRIESCLNEFVSSTIEAWNKFEDGKIGVNIKQLPKPMYLFVTQDLPKEINNLEVRDKLIKKLKLFVNTVEVTLNPKEETEISSNNEVEGTAGTK